MDPNQLIHHCNQKSAEELSPFHSQWVAWSDDGRQILASAADLDDLFHEIDRLGLTHYVLDYLSLADEDFLGGTAGQQQRVHIRSRLRRGGFSFTKIFTLRFRKNGPL